MLGQLDNSHEGWLRFFEKGPWGLGSDLLAGVCPGPMCGVWGPPAAVGAGPVTSGVPGCPASEPGALLPSQHPLSRVGSWKEKFPSAASRGGQELGMGLPGGARLGWTRAGGSSAWKRRENRGLSGRGSQAGAVGVPGQPLEAGTSFGPESEARQLPLFLPCSPETPQKVRAQRAPAWVCCEFCGPRQAVPRPWLCALGGQRQTGFIQALPK